MLRLSNIFLSFYLLNMKTKVCGPACSPPGIFRNILRPIGDKNTAPPSLFLYLASTLKKDRDDSLLGDLLSISGPVRPPARVMIVVTGE